MSVLRDILAIAREQSAAIARGDLEHAVRLLEDRAPLIARLGPVTPEDAGIISDILRCDRELSGTIRERMIELRDRAAKAQHGRHALAGYYIGNRARARVVNTVR